jgi:hypothetical protein
MGVMEGSEEKQSTYRVKRGRVAVLWARGSRKACHQAAHERKCE